LGSQLLQSGRFADDNRGLPVAGASLGKVLAADSRKAIRVLEHLCVKTRNIVQWIFSFNEQPHCRERRRAGRKRLDVEPRMNFDLRWLISVEYLLREPGR
jgi:hypothetical protein